MFLWCRVTSWGSWQFSILVLVPILLTITFNIEIWLLKIMYEISTGEHHLDEHITCFC
ncbi:hypothetical protein POUND7_017835 [Theobroma cacao]